MIQYTGTKTINARPMSLGSYNDLRGWDMPEDEDPNAEGYLVEYLDGGKPNHPNFKNYISWSPADVFERSYKRSSNKAHEQRVIDEKDALDIKIEKLNAFIDTNPAFNDLMGFEQQNLISQLSIMQEYSNILGTRIGYFS